MTKITDNDQNDELEFDVIELESLLGKASEDLDSKAEHTLIVDHLKIGWQGSSSTEKNKFSVEKCSIILIIQ